MSLVFRLIALSAVLLGFSLQTYAQFNFPIAIPTTCTPIIGAQQIPAPGSGSVSISNLTRYGMPAQVCVGGTTSAYNYTYTAALTFNNATSTCAGTTWRTNGGPGHVYFTGTGTFDLTTQRSSTSGQGYYQYDNLTVTVNGVNYTVSSGIVQGRYTTTTSGTTSQTTFFVPRGGIPMTVNGQTLNVTGDLYRCLVSDATVTIVQE